MKWLLYTYWGKLVTCLSHEATVQAEVNLGHLPEYLSHEVTEQMQVDLCYLPLP